MSFRIHFVWYFEHLLYKVHTDIMVNIMIKASEYLENENKGKIILFQRLNHQIKSFWEES